VAARQSPERIHTFSIGMDESEFDESGYAAEVAAHLGTEHDCFA
jgi:asparagine synthase (glutamine-hydrolysing)